MPRKENYDKKLPRKVKVPQITHKEQSMEHIISFGTQILLQILHSVSCNCAASLMVRCLRGLSHIVIFLPVLERKVTKSVRQRTLQETYKTHVNSLTICCWSVWEFNLIISQVTTFTRWSTQSIKFCFLFVSLIFWYVKYHKSPIRSPRSWDSEGNVFFMTNCIKCKAHHLKCK